MTSSTARFAAAPSLQVQDHAEASEVCAAYELRDTAEAVSKEYDSSSFGAIPGGWTIKCLGDLGRVVRGGSPRPAGDPRFFNGEFIPWLTVASLTSLPDSDIYVTDTASHLTQDGAVRSRTLDAGTLIIANSGATLGVAKILSIKCCANDGIAAIVDQRHGDPEFLCHYINTRTTYLREVVATGNGQPNLNTGLIREIQVPLPQPVEQRAIAKALSDVDGLLGALDALIAKKRAIKQAAMRQLLTGKTRLSGFSGAWETKRLGDVAEVKTGPFGSTLHESDYVQNGTPIITVEHLSEFGVEHRNLPLVSDADRYRLRAYSLEVGDIVFSRVGSIDRNAMIRQSEAGWLFSGRLLRVRSNKNVVDAAFLSYQFHGETFRTAVRGAAVGQTMLCLSTQILKDLPVIIPSTREQSAIAGLLEDMDAEIVALEHRHEKAQAIKQGMMQQLLTGRVRLVPPATATTVGTTL